MKIVKTSVKLFFVIFLTLISQISNSLPVVAQENTSPPQPPATGTPDDNFSVGGTRGGSGLACDESEKFVTSLLGQETRELTVSSYPTFWFYIPYAPEDINYIEFALEETQEANNIYRTSIKLTQRSGIIKIKLPQAKKYSLKPEKNYTWDLIVYCASNETGEPDQTLTGWIKRIPIDSQLQDRLERVKSQKYLVYIKQGIMYDAVTNLAALHFANPENSELSVAWVNLLNMLGWQQLAREPLVESVFKKPQDQVITNFQLR